MGDLDLDINHYNISQLETFFRLPSKYNEHDINQNESDIRTVLLSSGHIAPHLKRDLILFLEEGKKQLIAAKIKVRNPTTIKRPTQDDSSLAIPANFPLPNLNPPSRAENVLFPKETPFIYTQPSEYFPGTLNQLDHRTLQKCISIDSRFRPQMTLNSDFMIHLPNRIPKVLSVECISFEIDRMSLYNISSSLGNNFIFISIRVVEQEYNHTFIVPDGHYDIYLLMKTLNRIFSEQTDTPFQKLSFTEDPNETGKYIIKLEQLTSTTVSVLSLDFTVDSLGNADKFQDSFSKLGYLLGFTKQKYSGETQYMGEIPVRMNASLPYFYLYMDDFQNRSAACFQPAFSQITMSPSILARISLDEIKGVELLSTPRKYFGPIDMARLQIRLLDPYGKVLQMDANFSFCLLLQTVYDI